MYLLIIFGSNSHVLKNLKIPHYVDKIILADRNHNSNFFNEHHHIKYDMSRHDECIDSLVHLISSFNPKHIAIIYASLYNVIDDSNVSSLASDYISLNIHSPLSVFQVLSDSFPLIPQVGAFISSLYAHTSPDYRIYTDRTKRNPLFYGVFKAALERGIAWLSSSDRPHRYNTIALGPMPKPEVLSQDPIFKDNLLSKIPSHSFVTQHELHLVLELILNPLLVSLRGATILLDGGLTL